MAKKSEQPLKKLESPWIDNSNSIWMASTVGLHRNIDNFNFPGKLSDDQRQQLLSLLSHALLENKKFKSPNFLQADKIDTVEKEFLFEHYLSPMSFHHAYSGEGFIIDKTGKLLATINLANHLELQITNCDGDLEQSWNRLAQIEIQIGKTISYAFSTKFGFLTSDAAECGTALRVAAYLHIPALIEGGGFQSFLDAHHEPSINVGSLQGSLDDTVGDLVVVRNNYTLGQTEENILSGVRSYSTKLMVSEKSERSRFKTGEFPEIKDKVSRAYGVLIHSYQIKASEAMNAIGLMKLGVELGLITGVTIKKLNALLFYARRAHLIYQLGEEDISQEELTHKRAEFIHKYLKGSKLKV